MSTAKKIVGTMLILFMIQLSASVAIPANSSNKPDQTSHSTFLTATSHTLTLSLFLREITSEESESSNEKSTVSAELIDFASVEEFLIRAHSVIQAVTQNSPLTETSRYKVHCLYLI